MSKRIFITATNTNIGKTYTTKKLMRTYTQMGLKIGVIKPIETGVVDEAPDGEALLELLKQCNPLLWHLDIEDVVPITYALPAAPFVASKNKRLHLALILEKIELLEASCDVLLIEGAGGLYVPIDAKTMMIDLIKELEAVALLVTHCSLGCINDTLLSHKALEMRGISHAIAFNCREEDASFSEVSEPYFSHAKIDVLKVDEDIEKIAAALYNL